MAEHDRKHPGLSSVNMRISTSQYGYGNCYVLIRELDYAFQKRYSKQVGRKKGYESGNDNQAFQLYRQCAKVLKNQPLARLLDIKGKLQSGSI